LPSAPAAPIGVPPSLARGPPVLVGVPPGLVAPLVAGASVVLLAAVGALSGLVVPLVRVGALLGLVVPPAAPGPACAGIGSRLVEPSTVAGSLESAAPEAAAGSDLRGLAADTESSCGAPTASATRSSASPAVAGGGTGPEPAGGSSCCGAEARNLGRFAGVCCPSLTAPTLPNAGLPRAPVLTPVDNPPGAATDAPGALRSRPGSRLYSMPRYEFRCRACGDTFEVNRPMRESSAPSACPQGHDDTVKLLSTVAVTGRSGAVTPGPSAGGGGGCCGGACGC
jgi:putative FmdB family regulatory protein